MARLVGGTDYLSYLPRKLIAADDVFRRLRPLNVQVTWPDYEVFLAYRRSAISLPATLAFIKSMKETANQAGHAALEADGAPKSR